MPDWDGRSYGQVSDLQNWVATQSLAGIEMAGHERVLDVGCGDGRITAAIAEQLPDGSIVGIDPSPRMVQTARTLAAPGSERLCFDIGDVLEMQFADEFDAIVSFNALHWVFDQDRALFRIRAALRGSGWVLVQVVCAGEQPSLEQTAMDVCVAPRWQPYFADFQPPFVHVDPGRYEDTVERAGLRVVEQTVTDLSWDFGSPEAFARWCRVGFDAWTTRLPGDAADAFVADVLAAYSAVSGSAHRLDFMQMRAQLRPA